MHVIHVTTSAVVITAIAHNQLSSFLANSTFTVVVVSVVVVVIVTINDIIILLSG
jgi:hypothetical protein